MLTGDVVHAGGFCFGQKLLDKQAETYLCLHFYLCPNQKCKDDVQRKKNHNLPDDRYSYDDDTLVHSFGYLTAKNV